MATLDRGTTGETYNGTVAVQSSDYDLDMYGVDVFFYLKEHRDGFPIKINLKRDEAMLLLAQLSTRLIGMAVGPPR
jgi:hypothetical protein